MWMFKWPYENDATSIDFRVHEKDEEAECFPREWVVRGTLDDLKRHISVNYHDFPGELPVVRDSIQNEYYVLVLFNKEAAESFADAHPDRAMVGRTPALNSSEYVKKVRRKFLPAQKDLMAHPETCIMLHALDHPNKLSRDVMAISDNALYRIICALAPARGRVKPVSSRVLGVKLAEDTNMYCGVITIKRSNRFDLRYHRASVKVDTNLQAWLSAWHNGKTARLAVAVKPALSGSAVNYLNRLEGLLAEAKLDNRYKIIKRNGCSNRYQLFSGDDKAYDAFIVDTFTMNSAAVSVQDKWITLNPKRGAPHAAMLDNLKLFQVPEYLSSPVAFGIDGINYQILVGMSTNFGCWFSGYCGKLSLKQGSENRLNAALIELWEKRKSRMERKAEKDGWGSWLSLSYCDQEELDKILPSDPEAKDVHAVLKRTLFSERELFRACTGGAYYGMRHALLTRKQILHHVNKKYHDLFAYAKSDEEYVKLRARREGTSVFVDDFNRIQRAKECLEKMVKLYGHR